MHSICHIVIGTWEARQIQQILCPHSLKSLRLELDEEKEEKGERRVEGEGKERKNEIL